MFRFFVTSNNISADSIMLSAEDSKHIRTLRLRPDEQFIVCDGNSTDYVCKLAESSGFASARIVSSSKSLTEPTVLCRVFIAYQKGDRLDYAVQKSVELGVHDIVLFESERCVAVPHDIPKKVSRLQRIALETAKLCNRGIVPEVSSIGDFEAAINEAVSSSGITLFFYESEDQLHIKDVLQRHFTHEEDKNARDTQNANNVSIITGPEGGFEPSEVELARSKGIPIVSLGARILRSETAPVVALAAIMYQSGNM